MRTSSVLVLMMVGACAAPAILVCARRPAGADRAGMAAPAMSTPDAPDPLPRELVLEVDARVPKRAVHPPLEPVRERDGRPGPGGDDPSAGTEPEVTNPRRRALLDRPVGALRVVVVDAASGQELPAFRYVLEGPGVTRRIGEGRQGLATVPVRSGMPANLWLEADGYRGAWERQVLLRADAPPRELRVSLRRDAGDP